MKSLFFCKIVNFNCEFIIYDLFISFFFFFGSTFVMNCVLGRKNVCVQIDSNDYDTSMFYKIFYGMKLLFVHYLL